MKIAARVLRAHYIVTIITTIYAMVAHISYDSYATRFRSSLYEKEQNEEEFSAIIFDYHCGCVEFSATGRMHAWPNLAPRVH